MRTYNFECRDCEEKFNVKESFLLEKENIVCPNCSAKLPDNVFEKLKTAAKLLEEYDESRTEATKDKNANYFVVNIQ